VQRREAILLLRDMSHFAEAMLVNFVFVFLRRLGEAANPEWEDYELYVKTELGGTVAGSWSGSSRNMVSE